MKGFLFYFNLVLVGVFLFLWDVSLLWNAFVVCGIILAKIVYSDGKSFKGFSITKYMKYDKRGDSVFEWGGFFDDVASRVTVTHIGILMIIGVVFGGYILVSGLSALEDDGGVEVEVLSPPAQAAVGNVTSYSLVVVNLMAVGIIIAFGFGIISIVGLGGSYR